MLDEIRGRESAIRDLLTAGQRRRLRQIALQVRGPQAFREPEVVAVLQLTADQRERIRRIEADVVMPPRFDGPRPDGPRFEGPRPDGPRPDGPPKGQLMKGPGDWFGRPNVMPQVLAVLTADQIARWNELTGPPFVGLRGPRGPNPPRPPGPRPPPPDNERGPPTDEFDARRAKEPR